MQKKEIMKFIDDWLITKIDYKVQSNHFKIEIYKED